MARDGSHRGRMVYSVMPTAPTIRLWLDADAAPRDVKDICIRASDRLKLETILVANQRLRDDFATSIRAAQTENANRIATHKTIFIVTEGAK